MGIFWQFPDDPRRAENHSWSTSPPTCLRHIDMRIWPEWALQPFWHYIYVGSHQYLDPHFILQILISFWIFNQNTCLHITLRLGTDDSDSLVVGGWMDKESRMVGWAGEWAVKWARGWIDRWTDRWMNRWTVNPVKISIMTSELFYHSFQMLMSPAN